jgi:two-component sensor histidine kinase
MRGMGEIDLPARLAPAVPNWATVVACATASVALAACLRLAVDLVVPHSAPFVFVYPSALLATLLAGWRSGLLALAFLELGVWYLVFQPAPGFNRLETDDAAALILNGLSGLLVVALAEAFRRTAAAVGRERAAKLELRDLLLRELNHRMKNNFQMVGALLDMQRRRTEHPETQAALEDTLRRLHSMAQAHTHLYSSSDAVETIDLDGYLGDLCRNLSDSLLLTGLVRLETQFSRVSLSRDRAVAVGLVVNELVTNAAKHAFPAGRPGTIEVILRRTPKGAELLVADDGVGLNEARLNANGLGRRLVESFAREAGAVLTQEPGPGTRTLLVLTDQPAA